MATNEGYKGLGRAARRAMLRRWRKEGKGKSLKAWAKLAQVGDAAVCWLEHKRSKETV